MLSLADEKRDFTQLFRLEKAALLLTVDFGFVYLFFHNAAVCTYDRFAHLAVVSACNRDGFGICCEAIPSAASHSIVPTSSPSYQAEAMKSYRWKIYAVVLTIQQMPSITIGSKSSRK